MFIVKSYSMCASQEKNKNYPLPITPEVATFKIWQLIFSSSLFSVHSVFHYCAWSSVVCVIIWWVLWTLHYAMKGSSVGPFQGLWTTVLPSLTPPSTVTEEPHRNTETKINTAYWTMTIHICRQSQKNPATKNMFYLCSTGVPGVGCSWSAFDHGWLFWGDLNIYIFLPWCTMSIQTSALT